jgi:hypothetical protein
MKMPRKGYGLITCDEGLMNEIEAIGSREFCKTNPEILRFLIREYKRNNNIVALNSTPPNSVENKIPFISGSQQTSVRLALIKQSLLTIYNNGKEAQAGLVKTRSKPILSNVPQFILSDFTGGHGGPIPLEVQQ